jgi:hypothetical protein
MIFQSVVSIVVLAKYPDIFENFRRSVEEFAPHFRRILVRDGSLIPDLPAWEVVQGPACFSMAGNANLGLRATGCEDVLYCGDDVEFVLPNTVEMLSSIAHSDPAIGILSPQIVGGVSNPLQRASAMDRNLIYSEERLAFVCVYLKRGLLNCIGFFDEAFAEYGYDDADFCKRATHSGYKLAVTPRVIVKHGFGTDRSSTFRRARDTDPIEIQEQRSRLIYEAKWENTKRGH